MKSQLNFLLDSRDLRLQTLFQDVCVLRALFEVCGYLLLFGIQLVSDLNQDPQVYAFQFLFDSENFVKLFQRSVLVNFRSGKQLGKLAHRVVELRLVLLTFRPCLFYQSLDLLDLLIGQANLDSVVHQ